MYKLIGFFAFVTIVAANDVTVGHKDGGRKIYNTYQVASPAIWRRNDNVTVNASDTEVISSVVITDMRLDKDGEAKIVEGGVGHKNVTIELKSPTVFRGYEFHVEVYTKPGTIQQDQSTQQSTTTADATTENRVSHAPQVPISQSNDSFDDNIRQIQTTGEEQSTNWTNSGVSTKATAESSTEIDTQTAADQEVPQIFVVDGTDIYTLKPQVKTGKDEELPQDVSTTPKTHEPTVTVTNAVPQFPSHELEFPKIHVVSGTPVDTFNPSVNTEDGVQLPQDISTTQKPQEPIVAITNAAPVQEVQDTKDQNNTKSDEQKPVITAITGSVNDAHVSHTIIDHKFEVPVVEQKDHTIFLGPSVATSTESVKASSTVKVNAPTSQTPESEVTTADTLEALDVHTNKNLPKKDFPGKYTQVPIPYKH